MAIYHRKGYNWCLQTMNSKLTRVNDNIRG